MGYNIEVSFNILKNSRVTNIKNNLESLATNCGCTNIYDDYEFENNIYYKREHCVTSIYFENKNIYNLKKFLEIIKDTKELYIETIYDDDLNYLLYASKYYLTKKMDKRSANTYKIKKRECSYSEDEISILNIVERK